MMKIKKESERNIHPPDSLFPLESSKNPFGKIANMFCVIKNIADNDSECLTILF